MIGNSCKGGFGNTVKFTVLNNVTPFFNVQRVNLFEGCLCRKVQKSVQKNICSCLLAPENEKTDDFVMNAFLVVFAKKKVAKIVNIFRLFNFLLNSLTRSKSPRTFVTPFTWI